MGQSCHHDQCCQTRADDTALVNIKDAYATPRSAKEASDDDGSAMASNSSRFDREIPELTLLKMRGGVKHMKPYKFKSGAVYTGQ